MEEWLKWTGTKNCNLTTTQLRESCVLRSSDCSLLKGSCHPDTALQDPQMNKAIAEYNE